MVHRLLVLLLAFGFAPALFAHDPGLSTAQVVIRGDVLIVSATFAPADLNVLKPAAPPTAEWIAGLFELQVASTPLVVRATAAHPAPENEQQFELTFSRPPEGGTAVLRARRLEELPPGHRQFTRVSIDGGALLAERLLFVRQPSLTFELPPISAGATPAVAPVVPSSAGAFVKLGVEHIWTGYDHLLFLFGLLVVCTRFKSIVAIISCFTLAHSITLALATLDVVNLPSRYTEPLIAASIVFVGVENLVRKGAEPRGRWALTFLFGLIHGFGFASVLRELGVGQGGHGILVPLLTFNAGVELGQIAIAAVVLPLIWRLRKNETFVERGVPALSVLVAGAGLYWLLERTLFA